MIFCDPPYHLGLWQHALIDIDKHEMLNPEGIMIVEHGTDEELEAELLNLEVIKQVKYGHTTSIDIYERKVE